MTSLDLRTATVLVALASCVSATSVSAQNMSLQGGISSLGPVMEGGYRVQPNFGIRASAYGLGMSTNRSADVEDYTVDGTAKLSNFAIYADYYPKAGHWRVSGGLLFSNDLISGTFTGPSTFDGTLAFDRSTAPVIATGWDWTVTGGVTIGLDLGVVVSSLSVSSDSTDPGVQADVHDLNDQLGSVQFYPLIGATIGFRF